MYVPLRNHTHHSLLTGVGSPAAWLERVRQLGLPGMALCDVNTLGGLVEALRAATANELPLVVGAELAAPSSPGRAIALVQDETGYRNLCKLVSACRLGYDPGSQPDASNEEPFDLVHGIARWQAGLVFLVDHPRLLLELMGRVPARQVLAALSPVALRTEPNRHGTSTGETRSAQRDALDSLGTDKVPAPARPSAARDLLDAARATGAAVVAVPDAYYPSAEQRALHRLQVAIKHNALLADLPEAWVAPAPAHLLSVDVLRTSYAQVEDVPGQWPLPPGTADPLLARTQLVAQTCTYAPPLGGVLFPQIELEAGDTPYSRLCQLAFEGAQRRFRPLQPAVLQRLQYELSTIQDLGFAPYFLLVHRIAEFAREAGIPHVGRGSAADSLVAYCLRLTDADPFRYHLPFERFLNPARTDRPDIDLDFCWRRRDEVLEHVFELFGSERTAMISTLNRFGSRSAFREAALAHGIPPAEFQRWSRRIPMYGPGASFDGTAGPSGAEEDGEHDPPESDAVHSEMPEGVAKKSATQGHLSDGAQLTHPGGGGGGCTSNAPTAPLAGPPRTPPRPPEPPLPRSQAPRDPFAANPLAATLRSLPDTRHFPFHDPRFAAALRDAGQLLETPRHFGLHPGGVVVSPSAITDVLPCAPSAKGPVVTQFDKHGVEALGLVKMDLLGNRALTTLQDTLDLLAERDVHVDLESLPEDDPQTAELLRRGQTLGCFQVESPGMRHLLQQTGACTMDDVIQAVALIRPGPAQAGMKEAYVRRFRQLEDPAPPHPCLTEVLADTYGVMLYQEDVMRVAAQAAGMDLPTADRLRRALQKRRMDELPELQRAFYAGCEQNGLTRDDAQQIWLRIEGFASFAFCKAHAVTYGRIAYRAAWLKAHYPIEFLTAFLNSETGYYAPRVYLEEARRLGASLLGPDLNRSAREFCVQRAPDGRYGIRLGWRQVYGLSETLIERLLHEREQQPFLSLPDFLQRTGAHVDEARHLIRCGALDAFDRTRPELLWRLHLLHQKPTRIPRGERLDASEIAAANGRREDLLQSPSAGWDGQGIGLGAARLAPGQQTSLFAPPPDRPPVMPGLPDWNPKQRGTAEHELLGVSLHLHPTRLFDCPGEARMRQSVRSPADRRAPMPPRACADVPSLVGARITLRAWLAASRRVRTNNGQWMRFLTLEDETGIAEAVLFPNVYEQTQDRLASDQTLLVTGVVENQLGATVLHTEFLW